MMKYCYVLLRMAKIKKKKIQTTPDAVNVRNVKQLELLYFSSGTITWFSLWGWQFLMKLNMS